MPHEIERKWLVHALAQDFDPGTGQLIEQGYLTIAPGGNETRIRSKGERFTLTTKSGSGMVRTEAEIELTAEQFQLLWPATSGTRLSKTRHELAATGGLTIELDIYAGELEGLIVAEVEFPDTAHAEAFTPPGWFGADVTADGSYKNHSLAVHGRP